MAVKLKRKIIATFIEQYYRMGLTLQVLTLFFIVANLENILIIPLLILAAWLSGVVLDKVIRYPHNMASNMNRRSPELMEILKRVRNIEELLECEECE
jgi:hypothetical protein